MKWFRWIALWLLLESPTAFAGQMHYAYLELKDVPAQAGYVVAVLVTLVNAARRNIRLQVRVKQHWGALPETFKGKGDIEVTLNPGVEWTDPHVSPIDHRVRGFLTNVTPNSEVVLVPLGGVYEALPYDAKMKRKLDLFFAPTGLADYRKNAAAQDMVHDLQDDDLGRLAYEALQARKLLRAEDLLNLPSIHFREKVSLHLNQVPAADRATFLRAAARHFSGKPHNDQTAQLLRLLFEVPLELSDLAPLAELLTALDLRSEQANGDFCLLKDKLVERLKAPDAKAVAGLFVPVMARFALHRPAYRSDDPGTAVFLAHLDGPSRVRMARELLAGAQKNPRFDHWLFETAMPVTIETPSRDYLTEFASLDLNRISGVNWQVAALVQILKAVLRLVEVEPTALPAVRKAIDPMCANQSIISFLHLTSPEGKLLLERYQKLGKAR